MTRRNTFTPMVRLTLVTWLLCSFIGTLLLYIGYMSISGERTGTIDMLPIAGIALVVSLVGSIPAMLGFGFMANAVYPKRSAQRGKLVTSVYAVAATLTTFFIALSMSGLSSESASYIPAFFLVALPYAVSFVLAICIQKWPGQRPPEALWPDSEFSFEAVEKPRPAPFPAALFYAVIALVSLGLLITFFQVAQTFFALRSSHYMGNYFRQLVWMASIAVMIAGLIIFGLRRRAGWGMLMILYVANIAGQLYSIPGQFKMLIRYGGQSYLIFTAAYFLIDTAVFVLLLQPALRRAFRIPGQQFWGWILGGVGYCILRLLLFRML